MGRKAGGGLVEFSILSCFDTFVCDRSACRAFCFVGVVVVAGFKQQTELRAPGVDGF